MRPERSDTSVEALFVQRRARMLARASTLNLWFMAGGVLGFVAWDFWLDPQRAPQTLLVRALGAALLLLLIPLLRSGRVPELQVRYVYGGAFLLAILTVGVSVCMLDQGVLYGTAGIVVFPTVLAFYSIPIGLYLRLVALALALLLPLLLWAHTPHAVVLNFVVYYLLLSWIGYTAAHMLRRQQLRVFRLELKHAEDARTDPLTGLTNRRQLLELGEYSVERAHAEQQALALAVIDLDHFKRINDRYGHDVGDRVLVAAAQALQQSLGATDVLARFGGEEFVLLMPGRDAGTAGAQANAALARLRAARVPDLPEVRLSASIGLALLGPGEAWSRLLHAADQALLRAKLAGRDCLIVSSPEAVSGEHDSPRRD